MIEKMHDDNFLSQGPCPYFKPRESVAYAFSALKMPARSYEALISEGFRRNGMFFYKNVCPGCRECIPIRVDVRRFAPSKSQRRVMRKNADVTLVRHPTVFDPEGFRLYRKYCRHRHQTDEREQDYIRFLIESPVPTEMMRFYAGRRLMGIGWVDVLPRSLSSVYFAFDPDFSDRSPGVFSLLGEIDLCRELGKIWLQLGFWIRGNPKMSYKNRFRPHHMLIDGKWRKAGKKRPHAAAGPDGAGK